MALEVIRGPFTEPPVWSPSTVTFVRTKLGLREIDEPRTQGTFGEHAGTWLADKMFGGRPQFWQVDLRGFAHPEVKLELFGQGGILKFDIRLNFNVRVVDAKRVLKNNVRDLDGYFTPALRKEIAPLAKSFHMAQSHQLQEAIIEHFGRGSSFSNDLVEVVHLTVQTQPANPEALKNMERLALVPTQLAAIEAEVQVTRAEIDAFDRKTGGMTVDALARAAIATGNPKLIQAYHDLRKLHEDEAQRNWQRLKFLVDEKLLEVHDLHKYLGPLSEELINSLTRQTSMLPPPPNKLGKN